MAAGGPDASAEIAQRVRTRHPEQAKLDVSGITAERMMQKAATPERYKEAHEEILQSEVHHQKVQEAAAQISDPTIKAAVESAGDRLVRYLDGNAQPTDVTFIRDAIENALKNDPHHAAQLTGANRDAYIDSILSDPRFEMFLRRDSGVALETQIDDSLIHEIQAKSDARDLAELKKERAKDEFDRADTVFKDVDSRLQEFDHSKYQSGPNKGKCKGERAQEIEDLRAEKPTLETELKPLKDRLTEAGRDVTRYEDAVKKLDVGKGLPTGISDRAELLLKLQEARDAANDIRNDIQEREAKLQRLEQLETEEESVREQHPELKKKRDEAEIAAKEADNNFNEADRKLTEAQNERKKIEDTIKKQLEGVFGSAAREWSVDYIKVYTDALFEDLEDFEKIVPDKHMQAVVTALQRNLFTDYTEYDENFLYRITRGRRGSRTPRTEKRIDEAVLNQHIENIQNNGFDKFVVDLLSGTTALLNPETGVDYTPAEVRSLLAKKEFVETAGEQVFKSLMVAGELSETGLDQAQLFALARVPQGEGMLSKHMEENKKFRQEVDDVAEKEGFADAPTAEKARRAVGINPLILLMLLGTTFSALAAEEK